MAIKNLLFKNYTESVGVTGKVCCPSCSQSVSMRIFRNYDTFNAVSLLKGEDSQLGIAVCPQCAAAFAVNPDYLNAVRAGQTVYLTPEDLTAFRGEGK